jgi:hypothetical protein
MASRLEMKMPKKIEDFDPSQWRKQSWQVWAAPSWLLANNLLGFKSQ